MPEPTAEEAKAAGNAAFKAKKYSEAVAHFTAAIAADPGNHVLYSNRSAANAGLEDYKAALLDANKCIDIKPDWAKGQSRRGAAYVGLRNWPAAISAYETGLKLDPDSATMKEELASINAKLGRGTSADSAMPNSGATPSGGAAPAPPRAAGFLSRLAPRISALLLISAFFYVVPLLGARRAAVCYRIATASALALYAVSIFARHPFKFSTLRDPAVTGSHEGQLVWICVMLLASPPVPFGIVPFAAYAVHSVATNYGGVVQKLPAFAQGVLQPRLTYLCSEEGGSMVQAFAAISEVMVVVLAPLQIAVHGARVLILIGFYFQYVSRRHASSFWTKQAVSVLSDKARNLFHHRFCPAPIGMIYDKLIGLIGNLAARVR